MKWVEISISARPQTIQLGKVGENNATRVIFNVSDLIAHYGDGYAELLHRRARDAASYPAVTYRDDDDLWWVVSATDTQHQGRGECQLLWFVGDVLAKSIIYPTNVERALVQAPAPPEPVVKNWFDTLAELKASVMDWLNEAKTFLADLKGRLERGELNGKDGADGYTPVKGVDYFDGANGKDGLNGKDGADGYTPVKGVDYYTAEERQELLNDAESAAENAAERVTDALRDGLGSYELLHGYYPTASGTAGVFTPSESYRCLMIPVCEGEKIVLTGTGAASARLWAISKANGTIVRRSGVNVSETDLEITIEHGEAYFYYNTKRNEAYSISIAASVKRIGAAIESINRNDVEAAAAIAASNQTIAKNESDFSVITGYSKLQPTGDGYINILASPVNPDSPTADASYEYYVIDCTEGDMFTVSGTGSSNGRLWCFIRADGTRITYETSTSAVLGRRLTAPAESKMLIVNIRKSQYSLVFRDAPVGSRLDALESSGRYLDLSTFTPDKAINIGTGLEYDATGYICSDYEDVEGINLIRVRASSPTNNNALVFYDGAKNKLTSFRIGTGTSKVIGDTDIRVPYMAKYFRYGTQNYNVTDQYCILSFDKATSVEGINRVDNASKNYAKYVKHLIACMPYDISFANCADRIHLQDYSGGDQNVHPKVLYFPNKLYGHSFWMAYTPYPLSKVEYENPCVAYSDDGYSWSDIPGNPLAAYPGTGVGYNSDTHLVFNSETNELECWWRRAGSVENAEYIYRRTTSNGINWSEEELMMQSAGALSYLLSPAVIFEDGKYKMWVIGKNRHIYYYEKIGAGAFSLIRTISASYSYNEKTFSAWHIDVIHDSGKYIYVIMAKNTSGADDWMLFEITSDDNETVSKASPLMYGNKYGWDYNLYRSSIVNVGDGYRLYYSARSKNGIYGIGVSSSPTYDQFIGDVF